MDWNIPSELVLLKPSSFLYLPREMRNHIYLLLLTNTEIVKTRPFRTWTSSDETRVKSSVHVQLLRACRQLHEEASPILYGINTFQAHQSFLASLPFLSDPTRPLTSKAYISMVQRFHLCVRLDCDPFWSKTDLARTFSGLKVFEIEAWQSSFGTCGFGVLEGSVAVREVRKAIVGGCVGGPFARWLEGVMQSQEQDAIVMWEGDGWNVWEGGNR